MAIEPQLRFLIDNKYATIKFYHLHPPRVNRFLPGPPTALLRSVACLIERAVEAELVAFLEMHAGEDVEYGRARLVHHGYLPEREVMTGIGPVPVKVPRVCDRGREAAVHLVCPAALPSQGRVRRGAVVLAPSQGHFHRRFPGGTGRPARPGCCGSVVHHHLVTEGGLVKGMRTLAVARPRHPEDRLHLDRRCPLPAQDGRGQTMRPGSDRRR